MPIVAPERAMQDQLAGKRRPAPGSIPAAPLMQPSANPDASLNDTGGSDPSSLTNDQFLAWGTAPDALYSDSLGQGSGTSFADWMEPQIQDGTQTSHQLVRRNQNQELATSQREFDKTDMWSPSNESGLRPWNGDNGTLSEKAEEARREGLSQRPPKSIPPFIQKLSSFLDNNSNEDLIRWSTNGDSFVVLDEDQFARKLIPELFKHDKYASFVRQLNMYGFHKKVALTDNSMRASERKSKSPSEYENAYFKRGRPELLWLITKPGSSSKKKKKGQGEEESEEEDMGGKMSEGFGGGVKKLDLVTLPRSQLATFQSEIQQLQRQQQHINNMIARFQHENSQYIRQASERHERHENSINAILQFLATFYSRNADNSGNIPNMFGGNLKSHQTSGKVQEVNDLDEGDDHASHRHPQPPPRRPLLLPAPDGPDEVRSLTPEAAPSRPISSQDQQTSSRPPTQTHFSGPMADQSQQLTSSLRRSLNPNDIKSETATPELSAAVMPSGTDPTTVDQSTSEAQQRPPPVAQHHPVKRSPQQPQLQSSNSEIMRLIHNSNAASPNLNLDFSSALKNYENASPNGPLTPEQRNSVLSLMASTSGATSPMSNALLANANTAQPDYMQQFANNQDQIGLLQKLQQEQDSRVHNLAGRLQPLSPHGSIPGLERFGGGSSGQQPDSFSLNPADEAAGESESFDLGNWLNTDYVDNGNGSNINNQDFGEGFSFDDADNNYFGNVTADGNSADTTSGANTFKPTEELFNMATANTDNLFDELGDENDSTGAADAGQLLLPEDVASKVEGRGGGDSESGKVIGSVGTSSAGRSPNLEAVEDEEEGGRRKRQKMG